MKLRTFSILSIVIAFMVIVGASGWIFKAVNEMTVALEMRDTATEIRSAVLEGTILITSYVQNPNKRIETQWRNRHNSLSSLLSRSSSLPEYNEIKIVHDSLKELFERFVEAHNQTNLSSAETERLRPMLNRIIGQIAVLSQRKASIASAVAKKSSLEMRSAFTTLNRVSIGLVVMVTISIGILILFGIRRVLTPIQIINQGIRELGQGNLDYRIVRLNNDELGEISTELNAMALNLQKVTASRNDMENEIQLRISAENEIRALNESLEARVLQRTKELKSVNQKLESVSQQLELILDAAGEGIYGLDTDGHTTFANRKAVELLGWTASEMSGQLQHRLIHHTKPDGTIYEVEDCPIYSTIRNGDSHSISDEVFWRKDGSSVPVEYVSSPIRGAEGVIQGAVIVFRDISERIKQELELNRMNTELLASNRELEAFSYSVSHDLRAPLRAIDGFSNVLLEDYTDKIDNNGKEYLQRIAAAAGRMGKLIDDMLALSRLTRQELVVAPVDLTALARSIVDDLQMAEPERKVEIRIAEGCKAFGDKTLVRAILQNLIGNAWKFTANRENAQITFGPESTDTIGRKAFFVADNGAGFDLAHADKLFAPFQRLHRPNEYEGTGVGLATVQRAIHRHGGRVWAEAEVNKGATFHFEI